jgi:hypothetical protein
VALPQALNDIAPLARFNLKPEAKPQAKFVGAKI